MKEFISRRGLLHTTALAGMVVLSGCSSLSSISTVVSNLPQYAQDIQDLIGALGSVSSTVGSLTGLPASAVSAVQNGIAQVQSLGTQIVNYAQQGATVAGSLLSQFAAAVTSLATSSGGNATSGVSGLGTFGSILNAGLSLLPEILSVAGIALAAVPMGSNIPDVVSGRRMLHGLAARS